MQTIIIPLAGDSSRFFNAGYSTVKYKLPIFNAKPVLWHILSYMDRESKLLIVLNSKFDDKTWANNLLIDLGFAHFEIVEVEKTNGQLSTVDLGINNSKIINKSDRLIIFNGDTIRNIPFNFNFNDTDGLIEVFNKDGDHWSFTDKLGKVGYVTEKKRISNFCSTGLYGFRSVSLFLKFSKKVKLTNNEKYIIPIYNELIKEKYNVTSFLSKTSNFTLCGTPMEYELNKNLCK